MHDYLKLCATALINHIFVFFYSYKLIERFVGNFGNNNKHRHDYCMIYGKIMRTTPVQMLDDIFSICSPQDFVNTCKIFLQYLSYISSLSSL